MYLNYSYLLLLIRYNLQREIPNKYVSHLVKTEVIISVIKLSKYSHKVNIDHGMLTLFQNLLLLFCYKYVYSLRIFRFLVG